MTRTERSAGVVHRCTHRGAVHMASRWPQSISNHALLDLYIYLQKKTYYIYPAVSALQPNQRGLLCFVCELYQNLVTQISDYCN